MIGSNWILDPRIEALVKLQIIVSEEDTLKRELTDLPQRKRQLELDFKRAQDSVDIHHEEVKRVQLAIRAAETETKSAEQDMAHRQGQLIQVKTNKEYTAMLHEIEAIKKRISDIETRVLGLMEGMEEKKKIVAQEEAYLAQHRKTHERDLAEMDRLLKDAESKMATITARKNEILRQCDPRHLKLFDKLHSGIDDGRALVPANDGNCGGCRIKLTPQVVSDAKWGQSIVRCNNCARILYWIEAETTSSAA